MNNIKCPHFSREELSLFDGLPSGVLIITKSKEGRVEYTYSNPYLAYSLDYTHDEFEAILTENPFAAIYEADREKTANARDEAFEGKVVDSISRQRKKDGTAVWVLAHIRMIEVDEREGMLLLFSSFQQLIGLENSLLESNESLNDIVSSIPIGLLVFKIADGVKTTLSVNKPLLELANIVGAQLDSKHRAWTEAEFAMIMNKDLYSFCEENDVPLVREMIENSAGDSFTSCTFRLRGSGSGKTIYIYSSCNSKELEDGGRIYYVTFQNVTLEENQRLELVEKQIQLYKQSHYDALTGVKNRTAYNEFCEYIRENRIYNVGFAFCDINGLKQTNDTLGHQYGDQMIQSFVNILKEFFSEDNIYRLSGDEFVVIVPEIERADFQRSMGMLLEQVAAAENIASVGFIWKSNVSDIQRRTTQAEQIMYVEKQRYYERSRAVSSKHRPKFLEALLRDFDNGRFVMYLQPKTSIDDERVIGAEALARKLDEDGNIIPPYEFVPMLEQEKLIPMLDFYILERACEFLQEQHYIGNDSFALSVNISRVTIVENEFLQTVASILDKYEFERRNLEFELTESNKTLDSIRLEEYLIQLKRLGLKISIDDMGTDYSSLTMLLLDGLDWVKLDRSLIVRIGQEKAMLLLKNCINMCHDMSLKVIAEGVENHDDRTVLMDMGCDAYQGYLKSKPIPSDDFKQRFLE